MANITFMCELCSLAFTDENTRTRHLLGKKHQLALHNAHIIDVKEKCGIFVTGLPNVVAREEIISFFGNYGKIMDHHFGDNNRFLIVQYNEPSVAEKILNSEVIFKGRKLFVKPRTVREKVAARFAHENATEEYEQINQTLKDHCRFDQQLKTLISKLQPNLNAMTEKYSALCRDLQRTLRDIFPGCVVYPFGSTITGLGFQTSDVDIYVEVVKRSNFENTTEPRASEYVNKSRKHLIKTHYLFSSICGIPRAKIPIVKCVHLPTNVSCDFNFKNMLGICNSYLIRYFLSLESRLTSLMIIIKYWGRNHDLVGNGKFSNYSLVMLFIFYLQQPPYLFPSVLSLQESGDCINLQEGWNAGFEEITNVSTFTLKRKSLPELLSGFFNFYASFDYTLNVICPYLGCCVPKTDFLNPDILSEHFLRYKRNIVSMQPLKVESFICLQDPFEHSYNLTGAVSSRVFEEFVIMCKLGEKIFVNASGNDPLLYRLFTDEPDTVDLRKYLLTNDECKFKVPMGSCLAYLESKVVDGQEDKQVQIRKAWYHTVNQFIISVMINVLKFKVTVKTNVPDTKFKKLNGQADVHDTNCVDDVTFHCSGTHNLWDARKAIAKDLDLSAQSSVLDKQSYLSDYIYNVLYRGVDLKDVIIEFDLTLLAKVNPTEMEFVLLKCSEQKGCFKNVCMFFVHKLPSWFDAYVKDLNAKCKESANIDEPVNVNTVVVD